MKLIGIVYICLTLSCQAAMFDAIEAYLDDDGREAMLTDVAAGSGQSLWISCPKPVYRELFHGEDTLAYLVQKRKEPDCKGQRIERLMMLSLVGKPAPDAVREGKDSCTWSVKRALADAIYAGFPKTSEAVDWDAWWAQIYQWAKMIRDRHVGEQGSTPVESTHLPAHSD